MLKSYLKLIACNSNFKFISTFTKTVVIGRKSQCQKREKNCLQNTSLAIAKELLIHELIREK